MQYRRKTREILIGRVGVGGENPIRIQSMTTSNTRDVIGTVEQILRLADAGCEIVRITVQGMKEAISCEEIKNLLLQKGCEIPLVADIHFYPPAALKVVESVDKVRINPGNFADKRAIFKQVEYSEEEYLQELLKIEEKFSPLVEKCKKLKRAMRIGTNHGSLSDRIMNRFGDTPKGMVESALEYARICRKLDFHEFLFSMKASAPQTMILAYRMLCAEMDKLGWDYPLHLGVTEAGIGEDGRVKSAVGIGSLLLDGIGDTIRVSLTEDPWEEIDPCRRLISLPASCSVPIPPQRTVQKNHFLHPDGAVFSMSKPQENLSLKPDAWLNTSKEIQKTDSTEKLKIITLQDAPPEVPFAIQVNGEDSNHWAKLKSLKGEWILFSSKKNRVQEGRKFFQWLEKKKVDLPVVLAFDYSGSFEDVVIQASAECGALLVDGLGEGILLRAEEDTEKIVGLSFNILQACGKRSFKTEFISCPGCGRTLFHLQEVTQRIQAKTAHLPGVKIAVMGCIVNGPGEMAGADFGYVGSAPGKIDLYVGKTCVEKNVDFSQADERLIELIKEQGRWIDNNNL